MVMLRVGLPILLGIVAAVMNLMILRSGTAPLELTAIRKDVPADTELTEDMLEPLPVQAPRGIFKSAVRYSDRGVSLLGRRVARPLSAGEVLLYADVHNIDEENISLLLKPGESTLTFAAKPNQLAADMKPGNSIGVLVQMPPAPESGKGTMRMPAVSPGQRMVGPFRLLGLGSLTGSTRSAGPSEGRLVTVAVVRLPDGRLDANAAILAEAITAGSSSFSRGSVGILKVEYYQAAK